jgi:hypothetical protein
MFVLHVGYIQRYLLIDEKYMTQLAIVLLLIMNDTELVVTQK